MTAGTTLAIVILSVEDLRRSVGFYRSVFGWAVEVDAPVYVEFRLPDGMRLGLYRGDGFARNVGEAPHPTPPGAIGATELYLFTDGLGTTLERAAAAGGRLLAPPAMRDWGDEVAYVADPDGNVLALARPTRA